MHATTTSRRTLLCAFGALLLAAQFSVTRLSAQGTTATILGIVTDASGAAVPEASVQLRNVGTGATQSAVSDDQGRFRIADVGVGEYDVQASKTGFSTVVHKGVTLNVGAQTVVDFALPVGQQQQTVTVEGQVSQVQTTNSTVAALVDERQMRELPLNGRNFEQLIQLAPGVNTHTSFQRSGFQGRADQYSVAGGRPEGQAILLDDENLQTYWNKGMGSITGNSLGIEAIGEFQTLTNTFSAQFGGNGAVINAVSKSGTNSLHGSAYDFLRNSALDARRYFDNFRKPGADYADPPSFHKNQFGGSLGGPIKKDRTFFFANYEGVRQLLGETHTAFVPDATHRAPIPFDSTGKATPAANPAVGQAITNTMAILPLPDAGTVNPSTGIGSVATVGSQTAHENYVLARLDHTFSEKDSLFVRYIGDKADLLAPFNSTATLPYWGEQDRSFNQFSTVEWRRILTPNLVNVARVSFSRTTNSAVTTGSPEVNGTHPLQYFPGTGRQDGNITFGNISSIGGNTLVPFDLRQNRFTEADDLLWTHGAHSLRFGAAIGRLQSNTYFPSRSGGAWVFQSLALFLQGTALTMNGALNTPAAYPHRDFREIELSPYIQDDWKVTSKLTLNIGLRWEFRSNPVETHNQLWTITNFATDTAFVNVPHVMKSNPTHGAWDPRFGFAYDPFANHKTSIRGGFGMFRNPILPPNYGGNYWGNKPWFQVLEQNPAYPTPFATSNIPPFTQPSGFDYSSNTTPYMMQYNLNVQREIAQGTVVSVGYVGSHGVHLLTQYEHNPPIATTDANGVQHFGSLVAGRITGNPRLNPFGFFTIYNAFAPVATSRYNSLQATLNRRFTRSTQVQVAYTLSRCVDDGGSWASYASNSPNGESNPYNFSQDKGVCSFDVNQSLRVNGLVALPFHGNRLVEGWQVTAIATASTGLPFNIGNGFDIVGYQGSGTPRPNFVAGCNPSSGNFTWAGVQYTAGTPERWLNPNCFSVPAVGTLGNTGRNTGRGPGYFGADFGLIKDTKITEALRAQFRAEFFNIFNHTNFAVPANAAIFVAGAAGQCQASGPGCGAPNSTAGAITDTVGTARQIQFALKFVF
jgi:hypothetical protein